MTEPISGPPVARREPVSLTLHGDTRVDEYRWLQEKTAPEVTAYLEAENAYARALLADTEALQECLYREMVGRIQETDVSAPYPRGEFLYYSRTEEGKQYAVHCRKPAVGEDSEEILLDLNALSVGHPFLGLGAYEVSDDGRLLAYSLDFTGFRQYTLFVKHLGTGEVGPEAIPCANSVAWAADNRTLFYVNEDGAKRPYRLHRHDTEMHECRLIREETDERFRLAVQRTRSGEYLLCSASSLTADEVSYLPAAAATDDFRTIAPREPDHEYDVAHRGDRFYIRTNSGGRNFRVVTAPVASPERGSWKELVPHDAAVMRERLELFAGHLVLHERENGLPHLRVLDLETEAAHRVSFTEPVYEVNPEENHIFGTGAYRFAYSSLTTPRSVYDYDLRSRERRIVKQDPVPGYDAAGYCTERRWATAPDGVRIPISLVYRADRRTSEPQPLYLIGYGSYGYSYPVGFQSTRVSLLDRGVSIAIAHIRGGGELGKPWHDDGRMLRKPNTFTDFIAAAEYLIAQGFTTSEQLVIQGGSAGGLLMGAVVNLRPELFRAVVSLVPFVDVLNTMSDPSLPLTVGEYEEWGNPQLPEQYACMRSYCPYTNLRRSVFPALLVRTSFHDSQVMYWEPAKYVARLRTLKEDGSPLLFLTNMAGGHGGSSGRYDRLREIALDYAFVLREQAVAEQPAPNRRPNGTR